MTFTPGTSFPPGSVRRAIYPARILAGAVVCLVVGAAWAGAQSRTDSGSAPLPLSGNLRLARSRAARADAGSTDYRLNPGSTYQIGCFPPCRCPLSEEQATSGTFVLTPAGADGSFAFYDVTDVDWVVHRGGHPLMITGSGIYQISINDGGQQRLTLDLSLEGRDPIRFDSGLVSGGGEFPVIQAEVSLHGRFCYDTVLVVDASPKQLAEVPAPPLARPGGG